MPIDPWIARGVQAPDLTGTLLMAEEIKNRRQYNSLLELDRNMRQQQFQAEQQAGQQAAQQAQEKERQKEQFSILIPMAEQGNQDAIDELAKRVDGINPAAGVAFRSDPAQRAAALKVFRQQLGIGEGQDGGPKFGSVNPGDYTPESVQKFRQTGNYADLTRVWAPPQPAMTVINGIPTVVDKATATTRPLSTLDSEANAAATIEGAKVTGREEATRAAEAPQRIARARSNIEGYQNTVSAIDRADKLASGWTTGIMSRADFLPGTPQYDLKAELVTIMANIGFDRLQRMRDESPTGGALGQVAIQELTALQNSIANLDRAQSPEQFRTNLRVVRDRYAQFKRAQERAIQQEESRIKGGAAATKEDPLGIR